MDECLNNYLSSKYPLSATDLFAVFMDIAIERLSQDAKMGMINMHNWMFNYSFVDFRKGFLRAVQIESLLHLGVGAFEEINGAIVQTVSFIVCNHLPNGGGNYFRLVEANTSLDKKRLFLERRNDISYMNIPHSYFDDFEDNVIGYWITNGLKKILSKGTISSLFHPATGMQTGDNKYFIRIWHEVSYTKIKKKWFPYIDGGKRKSRKWYGNLFDVLNWENDGLEIRGHNSSVVRNPQFYFQPGITWNRMGDKRRCLRFFPKGFLFDQTCDSVFAGVSDNLFVVMGYLSTPIAQAFYELFAPGLSLTVGTMNKIPYIDVNNPNISTIVENNIIISKSDWDAHETSWDFEENELIRIFKQKGGTLEQIIETDFLFSFGIFRFVFFLLL